MKKLSYVKPKIEVYELDFESPIMDSMSGFPNGHDNGNHHGWDNPHNPHYGDSNPFNENPFEL